ncbi:hypothetical protein HKD37_14G040468 [Glycine soja]
MVHICKWLSFCLRKMLSYGFYFNDAKPLELERLKALCIQWANYYLKDSLDEQASQGSFVLHGRQDVLTTAIGRPEHPSRVRAAGAGVTIKQYFGSVPRTPTIADPTNQRSTGGVNHRKSDSTADGILQPDAVPISGLALPPEPEVGPSGPRVSTKESCVAPSGNDPETSDSDKCRLYIEENPSRLVALGRLYEGSTIVHNIPLLHGQVKVGVEEVKDAEALVPVPTDETAVSLAKPSESPDDEVMWDATIFGVFNQNFLLYIKHEDLSEIAHGAENSDVYGFLEPQSIQRYGKSQFESESYIKSWIQSSKRDVYLGAYLNGALKGLDDTPQPKSKAAARHKGITECGYYVMHWISTIILGSFRNNWKTYFNEVRPLEAERFKALRIQWAQYYLKVRNQT